MFSKFSEKVNTIFLDPHSDRFKIEGSVNVILSPSLYWVKKVSLPVKYLRDVKNLLPSLFEGTIPDGSYSYSAYKSNDKFFVFAYEDKHVIDTLVSKSISPAQVKNVYFAQSEMSDIDGAVKINETQSIYLKDDIVVLLPCCWIKESGDLNIDSIELSKNYVRLKQFGHIVNEKALYKIASIAILLIAVFAIEYFVTLHKISTISELRDELFVKNSLKPTMIQNRSMLKEQKDLYLFQTKLREYISNILTLNLKKQEKLSLIALKGKKLVAEFSGVGKASQVNIEKVFKNKSMNYKVVSKNNSSWRVEIEL